MKLEKLKKRSKEVMKLEKLEERREEVKGVFSLTSARSANFSNSFPPS
jgi:hypothetical protein